MAQLKINLGRAFNHPNPETAKQGAEGVMAFLDQLEKALNRQALGKSEIDVALLGPHYRVDWFAGQLTNIRDPEFMCSISVLGQHLMQACSEKIADLQGEKLVKGPTATSLPFYSSRSNSQGSQDSDVADV